MLYFWDVSFTTTRIRIFIRVTVRGGGWTAAEAVGISCALDELSYVTS